MFVDIINNANYSVTAYAFPPLIIGVLSLILAATMLRRERINLVRILLALMACFIALWLFSDFSMYSATREAIAIFWAKAAYLGIPFIPPSMYHFAVAVLRIDKKHKPTIWAGWVLAVIFSALSVTTDLLITGAYHYSWGYSPNKSGPLSIVFLAYMLALIGLAFYHLRSGLKQALPDSIQYRRIRSLLIAFGIGCFGLIDYFPSFGIAIYPFGFLGIYGALWVVTRTIKQYRLVDITPRFAANSIIDTMNDALIVLDAEGFIRLVNASTVAMLGQTEQELLGRQISTVFDTALLPDPMADRISREPIKHHELSYVHPKGDKHIFSLSLSSMRDKNNQHLATVFIVRDITDAKQTEAALQQAHDKLERRVEERSAELQKTLATLADEKARAESIIAAIGDGISIQDTHYHILYQNAVHKGFFGDHVGESCQPAYQMLTDERGRLVKTDECGCPVKTSFKDGNIHTFERAVPSPDGTRYFEITTSPLKNAKGEIIAGIEVTRDLGSRKQTEAILRESEEKYRFLVNNIPAVVWTSDSEGHMLFISPKIEGICGFTAEDIYAASNELWFGRIHPDDRAKVIDAYASLIREKVSFDMEYRIQHKNGKWVWIHDKAFETVSHGSRQFAYGIFSDITEHKTMEEEVRRNQKLESLGILAGGIAHDFNNILTAILGNVSLVKMQMQRGPDSKLYQYLEEAEKASLHARDLTQQLLTFSRGGAPIKKTLSLSRLIKNAAAFALRGSNIKCEFAFAEKLWPIEADEAQVGQIFNNLVINACQAMPAGGTLRIGADNVVLGSECGLPLKEGKYVEITVQDQGIGIAAEYLDKIFDPYFTTKQKGSGLGLAVTYSIIKNHDGYISVRSTMGAGTIFIIHLPASEKKILNEEPGAMQPVGGSGRVLIMDDEEFVRTVAHDILTEVGYHVDTTKDGVETIAAYRKAMGSVQPYDAVIMDLTIPGAMGGREAIALLRELDPEVKAIVSSGYSDSQEMANYRAYGFQDVIAKPYTVVALSTVLHKVIAGSKSTRPA
jgi:PAS domain S-box-containing protein